MLFVYALTLFLSAALLFLLEPMFAKLALPLLGGSPSVWTTCVLFFQATLLAGYGYVHLTSRMLGVRAQVGVHAAVVVLPALVLPVAVQGWVPPTLADPTPWLLWVLAACVGLPFFAVACNAPLLQRWFGLTRHPAARDPYFLYAASNAGSLIGLLSYPLLVEPWIGAQLQSRLWTASYAVLGLLTMLCAALLWRGRAGPPAEPAPDAPPGTPALAAARRLKWVALAFAPSSLMLGVTTFISTDLASMPLLWVVPLALYLASFVLVFARRAILPRAAMARVLPIAVSLSVALLLLGAVQPFALVVPVHLATLFIACMVCHGRLADDRPALSHLPEYYFWLGAGGMLGGVFNAVIAPAVFTGVSEFPLALVLVCVLASRLPMPRGAGPAPDQPQICGRAAGARPDPGIRDLLYPAVVGALCLGLVAALAGDAMPTYARTFTIAAVPVALAFIASARPVRFGLSVGAVLLVGGVSALERGEELAAYRTFFGVHRVVQRQSDGGSGERIAVNSLYHGNTLHGSQLVDPADLHPVGSTEPLAYYHREGPIGDVMGAWSVHRRPEHVGLVGLGAGAMAAYAGDGQRFTFFEIDPTVADVAQDPRYFRYLSDARRRGAEIEVVLGDARLQIEKAPDAGFDLLVLDAFSSDSVPMHLLSREAIALYLDKLAPGGVLAFHLSNRHLDLEPEMAALAGELGLVALSREDRNPLRRDGDRVMRRDSTWLLMARSDADLLPLRIDPRAQLWRLARGDPNLRAWSDDYSNLLRVFVW